MKYKIELLIILFLFGGIAGFLLIQPLLALQNNIFLVNGNNGTPTPCSGNTGLILAQNLTDLCDVTILSPLTNQIIQYNGSQWINVAQAIFTNETTVCSGQSGNYNLVLLSSGGNCDFKNLLAGSSISLSDNGTYITITNTGVTKLNAGTGISVNATTGNILVTNTSPESTSASNIGNGANVFKNQTGSILYFKTLLVGTGISVSNSTNTITFTNTGVISNSCVKGITCSGTNPSTFNTNFVNGTGISITGTGAQTFTNTGVTSLTSSNGQISLNSSTGNILITPKYQFIVQCSLVSANATLTCGSFTAMNYLFIQTETITASTGTGNNPRLRFNSDTNTATTYSWRTSNDGAADTTASSSNSCTLGGGRAVSDNGISNTLIHNTATLSKMVYTTTSYGGDTSSGTVPHRNEVSCKYDNTSVQITRIVLVNNSGTSNFDVGTQMTIWGYN